MSDMSIYGTIEPEHSTWIVATCFDNLAQSFAFFATESEALEGAIDVLKPADRDEAMKTLKFNRNLCDGKWSVTVRAIKVPEKALVLDRD